MYAQRSDARLQESLADVATLLERFRVLEAFAHRQETERRDLIEQLQHRQNQALLAAKLKTLHPADLAYILEALPPADRRIVWQQVAPAQAGPALVEVSEGTRSRLIQETPRRELVEALRALDAEDLGYLADSLPDDVLQEVSRDLDAGERSWLQESITCEEDSVGALMSREVATLHDTHTVEDALADLRRRGALPEHTDRLFVIDTRNVLRGAINLQSLLLAAPQVPLVDVMASDVLAFTPADEAGEAAKAFERYNLVSAPVVEERGKLIGRLTVNDMVDFIRAQADREALKRAGLRKEESLFSPVWDSARNRAPWLLVNLMTAFVASRVIGLFESSIEQLVALATLMPIVASVGGNTGNQTVALVIRGLALDQIQPANTTYLVRKELSVAVVNGGLWGAVMGLFAYVIYGSVPLGTVMMAAIVLNLGIAALVGIAVPVALQRAGRDPAQGSSVLLTFATDSMGFFLFLGLASVFLV